MIGVGHREIGWILGTTMTSGKLIEVDRVSRSFDGGKTFAVREITMAVDAGAFVTLVGASGSGKTTLLKMMNRLIEPDAGEIRIDGEPIRKADPAFLRRKIGYVFQGIGLFPHMTVGENIGITPRLLRWSPGDIAARTTELLDLVDLPGTLATRLPRELSGGQQQRVGVARAVAARPRIVLMDEPFGALDPVTRDALGSAYRKLHDQLGLTTIMVTHDMQEAVLLADRIVVLDGGAILADDTPRLLMRSAGDAKVAALMEMPRRQAERVRALMESEEAARG
jgi:osmoprotectant transport system ATP-binding protein